MVAIEGSWADEANIVYIDNPINVGFSEGPTKVTDQLMVADSFIKFMQAFLKVHPEYAKTNFFLTGESYAGKYIPNIANQILKFNDKAKEGKLLLSGIMIGNPYVDAVKQRLAVRDLAVASGVIGTDFTLDQMEALELSCLNAYSLDVHTA